jgi:hypothetical protein
MMPNKTLEPTAESAFSSASRATLFGRLWLSFIRSVSKFCCMLLPYFQAAPCSHKVGARCVRGSRVRSLLPSQFHCTKGTPNPPDPANRA